MNEILVLNLAKKIVENGNFDDPYRRGRTAIDTQFKLGL